MEQLELKEITDFITQEYDSYELVIDYKPIGTSATLSKKKESDENNKPKSSWNLFGLTDSLQSGVSSFTQGCKSMITGRTDRVIENNLMMDMNGPAMSGGTLGKVLVDVNKYKSAQDFFKDLSKSAIIGGSINAML